jgi:hypothetical protein
MSRFGEFTSGSDDVVSYVDSEISKLRNSSMLRDGSNDMEGSLPMNNNIINKIDELELLDNKTSEVTVPPTGYKKIYSNGTDGKLHLLSPTTDLNIITSADYPSSDGYVDLKNEQKNIAGEKSFTSTLHASTADITTLSAGAISSCTSGVITTITCTDCHVSSISCSSLTASAASNQITIGTDMSNKVYLNFPTQPTNISLGVTSILNPSSGQFIVSNCPSAQSVPSISSTSGVFTSMTATTANTTTDNATTLNCTTANISTMNATTANIGSATFSATSNQMQFGTTATSSTILSATAQTQQTTFSFPAVANASPKLLSDYSNTTQNVYSNLSLQSNLYVNDIAARIAGGIRLRDHTYATEFDIDTDGCQCNKTMLFSQTNNQLIFGSSTSSATSTTISVPAQTQACTLSIPVMSSSSDSFALLGQSNSFSGTNTIAKAILSNTSSQLAFGTGTSSVTISCPCTSQTVATTITTPIITATTSTFILSNAGTSQSVSTPITMNINGNGLYLGGGSAYSTYSVPLHIYENDPGYAVGLVIQSGQYLAPTIMFDKSQGGTMALMNDQSGQLSILNNYNIATSGGNKGFQFTCGSGTNGQLSVLSSDSQISLGNTYKTVLHAPVVGADIKLTMPTTTGTLALTSQVETAHPWISYYNYDCKYTDLVQTTYVSPLKTREYNVDSYYTIYGSTGSNLYSTKQPVGYYKVTYWFNAEQVSNDGGFVVCFDLNGTTISSSNNFTPVAGWSNEHVDVSRSFIANVTDANHELEMTFTTNSADTVSCYASVYVIIQRL